jgi:uncharacterized protein YdeI (YjbR/CyaY-like superfamily)
MLIGNELPPKSAAPQRGAMLMYPSNSFVKGDMIMAHKDPRVDAYIAKSAEFARPILEHLRAIIHKTCPDVRETMKWSFPHFEYKGILCSMAAFKRHCAFGFWKGALMKDPHGYFNPPDKEAMGHLGRIASLSDLPPDKHLTAYIKEAMELNDRGVPLPSMRKDGKKAEKTIEVPDYIMKALRKNKMALKTFEAFSYSHKKEYVEWIAEAKRAETRERRIAQMIEWLKEGKARNWKYEKKNLV